MTRAVVTLAETEHEVRVVHRFFPNGGHWSFFLCECGRRARVLKLVDDSPACRWCAFSRGVECLAARSSRADRREARTSRVGRLTEMLNGGPIRLHPSEGRTLDRRAALAVSLSRALLR
jgi:hypothetical protein